MIKACVSCRDVIKVPEKQNRCLDVDGPFVCSLPCVKNYIIRDSHKRVSLQTLKDKGLDVMRVNLDRRGEGTYSRILDKWFISAFERDCAEWFYCEGLEVQYEHFMFLWDGKMYVPDFYFPEYRAFAEIKGLWRCSNRSKYKSFRESFPEIVLIVIPWTLSDEARQRTANLRSPSCYFGGCIR